MPVKRSLIRDEQIAALAKQTFDVAVIGGGINGAAVARDAAMRGLRVALFDKGDFAGATSSRSSKLIHGGFRYLAQGRLGLVYEALHERERLRLVTAPHLVRKTRFLIPAYAGGGLGRIALGAGLLLYDLLARLPRAECHRNLSAAEVSGIEPALRRDRLRGGALYYDASTDDARLTWENALDAFEHGAVIANYVALEAFATERGRLAAAAVRDVLTGRAIELRARMFVNAAGPWTDDIRRIDDPGASASVRLTKGCHLLIARSRIPVREALALSTGGGRIFFVMPRDGYVLVGTTDTDFDGDPERVMADAADVEYLLGILNGFLPEFRLSQRDVESSFAGLRALVMSGSGAAPSSISREEMIHESGSGLLTIAGGKLTTHRAIAQRVVDRIMRNLELPKGRGPTLDAPLPGARPLDQGRASAQPAMSEHLECLAPATRERLISRYGTRAAMIAELVHRDAELAQPLAADSPVIGAEVIFATRSEMAVTLRDCLLRRIGLSCSPREARAAAPSAARLMARELGWSADHERAEQADLAAGLGRYSPS
ncbi:MAG TPA: glycerol-3-phosphate dehydrogenase/oxidase [Candidatus Binataceae bacterium]|nr:glycerol-3-phosphate dehydrogenase/oxidase [Candidatus Binataceae bacterium]